MTPFKVYVAHKMTGLKAKDITAKSDHAKKVLKDRGIQSISPWDKEKHLYKPDEIVSAGHKLLTKIWEKDKQEVLDCMGVIDIDGDLFSRGTGMEVGFCRYGLMRPTIFIDHATNTIRNLESDLVVATIEEAADIMNYLWGTRWKRWTWRLTNVWSMSKVLNRFRRELQSWR
jgi:nucleoside 2-deoxyribosyltransferase